MPQPKDSKPPVRWLNFSGYLLAGGLICAYGAQAIAHYQARQPQSLPVTAQLQVNKTVIALEVASTDRQKAIGLMHRSALPPNRGMLFPVEPPRTITTWMRNVEFDLDILFVRDGKIEAIAFAARCDLQADCPRYHSKAAVDQVIELAGGQISALGLKIGDRVSIESLASAHATNSP